MSQIARSLSRVVRRTANIHTSAVRNDQAANLKRIKDLQAKFQANPDVDVFLLGKGKITFGLAAALTAVTFSYGVYETYVILSTL